LALSSFGLVSAALAWGLGSAARHTGQFGRGLIDRETTRWDPLSRKAGYYLSRGSGAGLRGLARVARPNTIARG
jgi:type IV secretion system protein VirB6